AKKVLRAGRRRREPPCLASFRSVGSIKPARACCCSRMTPRGRRTSPIRRVIWKRPITSGWIAWRTKRSPGVSNAAFPPPANSSRQNAPPCCATARRIRGWKSFSTRAGTVTFAVSSKRWVSACFVSSAWRSGPCNSARWPRGPFDIWRGRKWSRWPQRGDRRTTEALERRMVGSPYKRTRCFKNVSVPTICSFSKTCQSRQFVVFHSSRYRPQAVRHHAHTAHPQTLRYPLHAHRCPGSQASGDAHFTLIALAPPRQLVFPPTQALEFLGHNTLGILHR